MKAFLVTSLLSALWANAQLIGPVGPTTALSQKTRECSILDYGAVNDNSTDVADSIEKAFNTCVLPHPGSRLIVPDGKYLIKRSVVLSNGTNWALQLDGLITLAYGGNWTVDRDGQFLQNGLTIINPVDFEFYSSNGKGAIQGQGYIYRNLADTFRPRLVRLISPIDTAVHDIILVDSPKFHIVFDFAENLEVYHLTIRGANLGSYDGVDVVGTNYWVHDIEVTNRDECVSVKSPSNHALIENLVCNQAGSGISIGSLNVSASIANIVSKFSLVEDFSIWTESGTSVVNKISNVYGHSDDSYGEADRIKSLASGQSPTPYTSTYTVTATPSGWTAPSFPTWAAASTGYGTDVPIPVYTPAALWKPNGDYEKHYWGSF
ncbi:hypothetical protein NW754_010699 [Fusarium falciforme]|nr:hypothetical protein NW754_010699 [Fusarium falciforme]